MKRILIANRGEIASRIIRTCKKMGLETVAVYSEADKSLEYVREADWSICIGKAPVNLSYLRIDQIIDAALQYDADGIHPGYGFLSENGDFAEKVKEAGLTFIGPKPEVLRLMGDKITARKTMANAGIPVLPASSGAVASLSEALKVAKEIGYPVMVKASGGGGGIGMALCRNEKELETNFASLKKKAEKFFANGELFIEKYVENARHVEVQVFGDSYGNVVHVFERDCSIQRRNQKVVEETPSPNLSEAGRERLCQLGVAVAKAIQYENAGTVEFIVDEKENIYFLEMNTRLQVEHGITEAVTGIDIVEWQIRIAKGESIPLQQKEIFRNGHSMEFRIYAEHPNTFFPSPGTIMVLKWGEGQVRIDTGYHEGDSVTPFYDPMIAKCIFHEENRKQCLEAATRFFRTTEWEGIQTNIPLFIELLGNDDFKKGQYTTQLLNKLHRRF